MAEQSSILESAARQVFANFPPSTLPIHAQALRRDRESKGVVPASSTRISLSQE
jgi:hypothetical protein